MIKAHIKYLITLCILLLSVSGQLVANTTHRQGASNQLHASSDNNIGNLPNVIFTSASSNGSENTLFDYNEEVEEDKESDDIISQKKSLENTYLSSTLFYSWYSNFFLLSNTQALHFGKHLSHFSYHKLFIVFQVFRV